MINASDELVFVPLGGLSEIGMNAALYGFGPKAKRKWLMVDCGLSFAAPDQPGIDLVLPDTAFIEKMRKDLVGLVITHAHEDHIGAIADLWPRLGCTVYATPFAAGLLETKRLSEPGAPKVPIKVVQQGASIDLAPFSVEYIPVAHSIPESSALAIRTPAGLVVHSGDWKIDPLPGLGKPTDVERFRALGDEGVLALISDSTNILREGSSPSEGEVASTLRHMIAKATGRVIVTTFASNVARIKAVAEAASACGRTVLLAGRAMERTVGVARELGYLEGIPAFLNIDAYAHMPRDRVVVLATGSQGEPRAAMARVAINDHPAITLGGGDTVIFSSRTIPGNEREVNRIINNMVKMGVEVITDRTHLVHCSGHPRRGEVAELYDWVRPNIAIPAHGEALHLAEHAAFARSRNVPNVVSAHNGDVVLLGPGRPGIIDEAPTGRLLKDGNVLIADNDEALNMRRKLSFSGVVTVALAITAKGDLAGDPDVMISGLPSKMRNGIGTDEIVDGAVFQTFDGLPRQKRRDADFTSNAIEKAVRNTVGNAWGKKPVVHVLVLEV